MKKVTAFLVMVAFFAVTTPAFSKGPGNPKPNAKAYEHANENARFKRDGMPNGKDKIEDQAERQKKDTERQARKAKKQEERKKKRGRS